MTRKLELGTSGSKDFTLPIDAATQTFAFIARKGAGKTYAAGKLVEQLMESHVQCVILDTVGNWYGLRLDADGKSKGFDIPVLGGLRGDIPLEAAGGELVADLVVETGRSLIVDVSQFSQADRKRFATAFGVRLWQRKKAEPDPAPVHLVIEESQLIVPQVVRGDDAKMVGIYEEIIRLGRNYGVGCSMISQRPQSVNKEVLTQTECLVVLQVNGAPERKALKEWIVHQGMDVKLLDELPSLPIGTAYVWSPQWLGILEKVKIGKKHTLDASATPKVGERRQQRELAPLDLAVFREKMAATIERAKADDPRELRRELAAARKHLAQIPVAVPAKIERVEVPMLTDEQFKRLESACVELTKAAESIRESALYARQAKERQRATPIAQPPPMHPRQPANVRPVQVPLHNGSLTGPEQRILDALAWMESIGIVEPEQSAAAFLAGYTVGGGAWNNPRCALRTKGLIEYRGDRLALTVAGRAYANVPDVTLTAGELQKRVMERLPGPEQRILRALLDAYPKGLPNDELARAANYEPGGGAYNNPRGRLRSLGVIEYRGGEVFAREILFP